ncbi:uncharacterized protein J3D65DRAFT_637150 [Phyllosticta citribraziliensis]|uniref:Uncharacterized protein n=1 Tax=Phyllosticta citribraziliensis TaxID=989973 RepID=A0ABR1L7U0_9PEZI
MADDDRPRLRQRSTPSWDSHHPRRRESLLSDLSSVRSSTDPLANRMDHLVQDENSHWHSAPLVFAILPAIGGLLFNNGSEVLTDVLLLGLATVLLNWCVRLPWDWYRSAQTLATATATATTPTPTHDDRIPEEDDHDDPLGAHDDEDDDDFADLETAPETTTRQPDNPSADTEPEYARAVRELRRDELLALAACFVGPVFGAYLLHGIRASLSRPSEGLVSNYNLTIFLLAAEIRPASHLLRLLRARTLYLQRIVRDHLDPDGVRPEESSVSDLRQRVGELETHMADMVSKNAAVKNKDAAKSSGAPAEVVNLVRQSFQPQLDALNRAVRRYEKRATTQTMVTEARLQDLESRLKDALALAAAAAAHGGHKKQTSLIVLLFDFVGSVFMMPINAAWTMFVYPFQLTTDAVRKTKIWLFGTTRKVDRKGKSRANRNSAYERGHASLSGFRTQAGSSRRAGSS